MNNISIFFFDLFGVLLGTDHSIIIQYVSKNSKLNYHETKDILFGEIYMEMERGKIDFNTYINNIFEILPKNISIDKTYLNKIWNNTNIDEMPAVSFIDKLLTKYEVWIVSNTTNQHINRLKKDFNFLNNVSGIITSESAGAHKPNPIIYNFALNKTNSKPHCSIFIDDNLSNIQTAEYLNFNTHHYKSFDNLIIYLQNYLND